MFDLRRQEKSYLIGILRDSRKKQEALDALEELRSLNLTAGAWEAGHVLASARQISPVTYLGRGTVAELKKILCASGATLVIIDADLSPSQNRNLEEEWDVRVIERTSLILDIFALHAASKEGKLQVQLAQYEYVYPRLVGAWSHFSRQRGGGVGLRGPGETQLEMDRRLIRDRIAQLKKSLKKVDSSRHLHLRRRASVPIPTLTLVGYTNAGKSSLFNALTTSAQWVEDKLFATLDPKTKKIRLPSRREVLVTDTVGFIRRLPHQLVEAFKSTFEEARSSDLLLHVIDGSHPDRHRHMQVVEDVLKEIKLDAIPVLRVFNKTDAPGFYAEGNEGRSWCVSAITGDGIPELKNAIEDELSGGLKPVHLFLPHPYGALLASLYAHGRVLKLKNLSRGARVEVMLAGKWLGRFKQYEVGG